MKKISALKGTRDFYPELRFQQNYVFDMWKKISKRFGYEEYDGPLLEPAILWEMKSGTEIFDQMYVFEDKAKRKIAVRPELTPILARMVAQKTLPKPIKWFSIGRFWRYENPQKGRLREFYQFNIDCLGSESFKADAEIILTLYDLAKAFKIDDLTYVRLSNRKILTGLLDSFGVSNYSEILRVIDKYDKLSRDDFIEALKNINFTKIKELLNFLQSDIDQLSNMKGKINETFDKGVQELLEVVSYLKPNAREFIRFDPKIVRGLDYYTSTVFELFDKSRKYRAIAGGGRYDDLVSLFNAPKTPGVGYAMGDAVILEFLKENNLLPEYNPDIQIFITNSESSFELAEELRKHFNVEVEVMNRSLKSQLKYASKKSIPIVILSEYSNEKIVKIKDMRNSEEKEIDKSKLIIYLKERLKKEE